jgi:anti-sigma B factor antagonist
MSTRISGGRVVVALRGGLDVQYAARVAVALGDVAAREPDIIVDLAGLEFIDSSGVAALVRARKRARHAGGDLLLAAPQQQVVRVLTLTRLIGVFPIHASVDGAFGAAQRSRLAAPPIARRPSSSLPHDLGRVLRAIARPLGGRNPRPGTSATGSGAATAGPARSTRQPAR